MEFDPLNSSPDSPSFDNGFEKLDSLTTNQEDRVTSTHSADDDLYSPSPEKSPEQIPPAEPMLVDISQSTVKAGERFKDEGVSLMSDPKKPSGDECPKCLTSMWAFKSTRTYLEYVFNQSSVHILMK